MNTTHTLPGYDPDHIIAGRSSHETTVFHGSVFSKPVESLFPDNKTSLVVAKKSDPIPVAFKLLIDNKILSCPVYDHKSHQYVGFVDMVDMVTHVLTIFKESELIGGELNQLYSSQEKLSHNTTGNISDLSRRNPWKPVDRKMAISQAVNLMTHWKVHRVPVVDSSGELLTLVTQSQICNYLHSHINEVADLAKKKISELGKLIHTDVVTIGLKDQVINAFKIIHDKSVSGVAVVDESGSLVGNISVSDLKMIGYDGKLVSRLFLSVEEFLNLVKPNETFGTGPIAVLPNSTYEEVLAKVVLGKIHRVYVVNESAKPIGVISQLELLIAAQDALAHHHKK